MGSFCSPNKLEEELDIIEREDSIRTREKAGTVERIIPIRKFMRDQNVKSQQWSTSQDQHNHSEIPLASLGISDNPICQSFSPPVPTTPNLGKPLSGQPHMVGTLALELTKPLKPPSASSEDSSPSESDIQVTPDCLMARYPEYHNATDTQNKPQKSKSLPKPPPAPLRRTPSPQLSAALPDYAGGTPSAESISSQGNQEPRGRIPIHSLNLPSAPKRPPLPPIIKQSVLPMKPLFSRPAPSGALGKIAQPTQPPKPPPPPFGAEPVKLSMVKRKGPPPVPDLEVKENNITEQTLNKAKKGKKRKRGARGLPRVKQVGAHKSSVELEESSAFSGSLILRPPPFTDGIVAPPKPPRFVPNTSGSLKHVPPAPPAPPMFKAS